MAAHIIIAIGGFAVGVLWGFNLLIAITKRKIRRGNPPKWIEDAIAELPEIENE